MTILACILIALGAFVSGLNWYTLFASLRRGNFVSAVPFFGAILLGCGLWLLPATRAFTWLAIVADYGTLVFFVALRRLFGELWSTSRINLVHRFVAAGSERTLTIDLFRRHIAVIRAKFHTRIPANVGARVAGFGMLGKWSATDYGLVVKGYRADRELMISSSSESFMTTETNYPPVAEYPYDRLDAITLQKAV